VAHGNDPTHGKVQPKRTAKKLRRQRPYTPHGKEMLHGKGSGRCRGAPFAVLLCHAFLSLPCTIIHFIYFSFYFISSNTYIYFLISFTY
jgi:hypothetical protein